MLACDPRAPNDSMNTLKRDLQKRLPSSGYFLFHDIESKCSKNSEKEEIECEVVEFDHETDVYETNDDTDLKLKLLIIFSCLLTNFMIFRKILLKVWLINMLSIFH